LGIPQELSWHEAFSNVSESRNVHINTFTLHCSRHDFNEFLGKVKVKSFVEKFPEAVENFRKAWIDYMKYCYQVESGVEVESVSENKSASVIIELDRDAKGYPLVPQEGGNLINMKRIIRSFITAHYRKVDFIL
jgi:hypothetical protein